MFFVFHNKDLAILPNPAKHTKQDNTMKKLLLNGSLAAVLFFAGCDGTADPDLPPSSDLTVTFKALYDGQTLEKYKSYNYDTYKVHFSRFNTFLSDITLLKGNEEFKLSDIEWVDFTPDSAPNDLAVDVPIKFKNVPDGDYTGIRIGYGVSPDLNAKQPNNFSSTHPLSRENEYWLGWKSYIFNKIEGKADLDNSGVFGSSLVYHCGSDAVYRTYTFNTPIRIEQGAVATVAFDLKKLFTINGNWFDLKIPANQITSNDVGNVVVATILMDNFDFATTVIQ